jgi:hypothetical protein
MHQGAAQPHGHLTKADRAVTVYTCRRSLRCLGTRKEHASHRRATCNVQRVADHVSRCRLHVGWFKPRASLNPLAAALTR